MSERRVKKKHNGGRPRNTPDGAGKAVAVRLQEQQRQWLRGQASERDITPSEYIRVVLTEQGMPE